MGPSAQEKPDVAILQKTVNRSRIEQSRRAPEVLD